MDTYIAMLEPLEWIREKWEPIIGDSYWNTDDEQVQVYWADRKKNILWLPSVEQLMEMLEMEVRQFSTGRTIKPSGEYGYLAWSVMYDDDFYAPTAREALLQLLQYAHGGSRWDSERWVKGE